MSKTYTNIRLCFAHWVARWVLYPLIYYVVHYRKQVVFDNLQLAFPDKSKQEHKRIAKDFYLYFCDMIVEILVCRHFSATTMRWYVTQTGGEEMSNACKRYGGCFVMLGHFLNWEWNGAALRQISTKEVDGSVVYKKLSSDFFDSILYKCRKHLCGEPVEMNHLLRDIIHRKNDADQIPSIYAMLADQRPGKGGRAKQYITTLLGQPVGMLTGTEQLARKFQFPIFYAYLKSDKRGHYHLDFTPMSWPEEDKDTPFGTITERYARLLEENIKTHPEHYLWTHKRFSHTKKIQLELEKREHEKE